MFFQTIVHDYKIHWFSWNLDFYWPNI